MRSRTAASASAASLPLAGGAITTFAPRVRNSCVSFRSASKLTFSRAEQTAAPLVSAIRATVRRPRLAPSSFHRIRRNIERLDNASLSPQHGSGIDARGTSKRQETSQQRYHRRQDQNNRKQNPPKGGSNAKNSNAQGARQNNSKGVSQNAADQCKKQLLGYEKCADGPAAWPQRRSQSH